MRVIIYGGGIRKNRGKYTKQEAHIMTYPNKQDNSDAVFDGNTMSVENAESRARQRV